MFLDEFNRANSEIRGALLELVNNHTVNDNEAPSGKRKLENFLFTVAAVNPTGDWGTYEVHPLDLAEISRFSVLEVKPDPLATLKHIVEAFGADLKAAEEMGDLQVALEKAGTIELAKALLTSKRFTFDDDKEEAERYERQLPVLNSRSLTNLLERSRGKKDLLLRYWNQYCNSDKKVMAEGILEKYVDIDDKANEALKKYAQEKGDVGLKEKEKSAWDVIGDTVEEVERIEGPRDLN